MDSRPDLMLRPNLKSEEGALSLKTFSSNSPSERVGTSPCSFVRAALLAQRGSPSELYACPRAARRREGKLSLVCGGIETASRNAEAILKELTARVRFIGKSGEAANVKALVNMVMNITPQV